MNNSVTFKNYSQSVKSGHHSPTVNMKTAVSFIKTAEKHIMVSKNDFLICIGTRIKVVSYNKVVAEGLGNFSEDSGKEAAETSKI